MFYSPAPPAQKRKRQTFFSGTSSRSARSGAARKRQRPGTRRTAVRHGLFGERRSRASSTRAPPASRDSLRAFAAFEARREATAAFHCAPDIIVGQCPNLDCPYRVLHADRTAAERAASYRYTRADVLCPCGTVLATRIDQGPAVIGRQEGSARFLYETGAPARADGGFDMLRLRGPGAGRMWSTMQRIDRSMGTYQEFKGATAHIVHRAQRGAVAAGEEGEAQEGEGGYDMFAAGEEEGEEETGGEGNEELMLHTESTLAELERQTAQQATGEARDSGSGARAPTDQHARQLFEQQRGTQSRLTRHRAIIEELFHTLQRTWPGYAQAHAFAWFLNTTLRASWPRPLEVQLAKEEEISRAHYVFSVAQTATQSVRALQEATALWTGDHTALQTRGSTANRVSTATARKEDRKILFDTCKPAVLAALAVRVFMLPPRATVSMDTKTAIQRALQTYLLFRVGPSYTRTLTNARDVIQTAVQQRIGLRQHLQQQFQLGVLPHSHQTHEESSIMQTERRRRVRLSASTPTPAPVSVPAPAPVSASTPTRPPSSSSSSSSLSFSHPPATTAAAPAATTLAAAAARDHKVSEEEFLASWTHFCNEVPWLAVAPTHTRTLLRAMFHVMCMQRNWTPDQSNLAPRQAMTWLLHHCRQPRPAVGASPATPHYLLPRLACAMHRGLLQSAVPRAQSAPAPNKLRSLLQDAAGAVAAQYNAYESPLPRRWLQEGYRQTARLIAAQAHWPALQSSTLTPAIASSMLTAQVQTASTAHLRITFDPAAAAQLMRELTAPPAVDAWVTAVGEASQDFIHKHVLAWFATNHHPYPFCLRPKALRPTELSVLLLALLCSLDCTSRMVDGPPTTIQRHTTPHPLSSAGRHRIAPRLSALGCPLEQHATILCSLHLATILLRIVPARLLPGFIPPDQDQHPTPPLPPTFALYSQSMLPLGRALFPDAPAPHALDHAADWTALLQWLWKGTVCAPPAICSALRTYLHATAPLLQTTLT